MTTPRQISFAELNLDTFATDTGHIAVVIGPDGKMSPAARRLNKLTRQSVARAVESEAWEKLGEGKLMSLRYPTGLLAEAVHLVCLSRNADAHTARKAGAALAQAVGSDALCLASSNLRRIEELAMGLMLRGYSFDDHKSEKSDPLAPAHILVADPEEAEAAFAALSAVGEGVFFTRDLINAPANVLTTTTFADQLLALQDLGLKVEVLEEDTLAELGMGALLAVGQGSAAPSKVVVMHWQGGGDEDPVALVGKGVVFDTGGISLKPAGGMEDMTMDMGGAGVVAGTMMALAKRKAQANVVGLVGLVENMPSSTATRPGDVVTSMKGDTIEVINTDAEGRLVLCDVMWYAQETFKPRAMIDLATLTGACIVALGHDNAAVYANDDGFCRDLLKAAQAEREGAWRMPLGASYDKLINSKIADMKNSGGRPAGSITAAQFLYRYVQEGMPWAHIDIAGVAHIKSGTDLAPGGATGWGVMTLNRLIADQYEG